MIADLSLIFGSIVIGLTLIIRTVTDINDADTEEVKKRKKELRKKTYIFALIAIIGFFFFINYSSLKEYVTNAKDVKISFSKTNFFWKGWFEEDPEPRLVKTVQYKPREWGPGGMTIAIPEPKKPYKIECKGEYNQLFYSGRSLYIGCKGYNNHDMGREYVSLMPIEDKRVYGSFIDERWGDDIQVNINIPQRARSYKDITGFLTINIYQ